MKRFRTLFLKKGGVGAYSQFLKDYFHFRELMKNGDSTQKECARQWGVEPAALNPDTRVPASRLR
jgi:hypothetical protein